MFRAEVLALLGVRLTVSVKGPAMLRMSLPVEKKGGHRSGRDRI